MENKTEKSTVEKVKRYPGLENISEDEAANIKEFAEILYGYYMSVVKIQAAKRKLEQKKRP